MMFYYIGLYNIGVREHCVSVITLKVISEVEQILNSRTTYRINSSADLYIITCAIQVQDSKTLFCLLDLAANFFYKYVFIIKYQ